MQGDTWEVVPLKRSTLHLNVVKGRTLVERKPSALGVEASRLYSSVISRILSGQDSQCRPPGTMQMLTRRIWRMADTQLITLRTYNGQVLLPLRSFSSRRRGSVGRLESCLPSRRRYVQRRSSLPTSLMMTLRHDVLSPCIGVGLGPYPRTTSQPACQVYVEITVLMRNPRSVITAQSSPLSHPCEQYLTVLALWFRVGTAGQADETDSCIERVHPVSSTAHV